MAPAPQFSLRDVERRWGDRFALAGVTLDIKPGERIALIGPSGSGKTTLLRLLMASLASSGGSIEVDGSKIAAMRPSGIRSHRQRCGLVDQGLQLIPSSSVHDNVIAGCVSTWPWWRTLLSILWPLERDRVQRLLNDLKLGERQWDPVAELSGGQQQRVSIARALVGEQSLLLADEPTAALDPTTADEVISLLARETKRREATLIISTHRVSQVLEHVDRIVGLREGRVLFDEAARNVDEEALSRLYAGSCERV